MADRPIRHCDVRYAVFSGHVVGDEVALAHLCVVTGEAFFTRFEQFRGMIVNRKVQIPLPDTLFD